MCNNENCEKKPSVEDLKFFLDGYVDVVDEKEKDKDDMVMVPREEYAALIEMHTMGYLLADILQTEDDFYSNRAAALRITALIRAGKMEQVTLQAKHDDKEASE